jgi:hypothetical protein
MGTDTLSEYCQAYLASPGVEGDIKNAFEQGWITHAKIQHCEIRLLNDVLPAGMKYAVADEITIEGRSKTNVVHDVWDELVSRGLVRGPKRELGKVIWEVWGRSRKPPYKES